MIQLFDFVTLIPINTKDMNHSMFLIIKDIEHIVLKVNVRYIYCYVTEFNRGKCLKLLKQYQVKNDTRRKIMKKISILLLVSFFLVSSSYSQFSKIDIGGNLGTNFLIGDSKLGDSQISPNLGIYTFYQHSPKLAFKLQFGYGQMKTKISGFPFKTSMIPVELIGIYSLADGDKFKPFVHAGLGVMNFKINNSTRFYDGIFIGGAGFKMPISPKFSFLLTADLRYTTGDDFDGSPVGNFKDGYFSLNGGLTYHLSKPQTFEKKPQIQKPAIVAGSLVEEAYSPPEKKDNFLEIIQLRSKIKKYKDELNEKIAQIEELKMLEMVKNQRISQFETQIADLQTKQLQTYAVENKEESPQPQVERPQPQNAETPALKQTYSVKQRYDNAIKNFNSRNYRATIMELTDLSNEHQNHKLASNFIYWIGECYVGLKSYSAAIEAFTNVTKKFKQSSKHDDALLMTGVSYLHMGESAKAKEVFEELLQKFPKSEYSKRANRYLQSINVQIIS